ncbi:MAG: hypothetical protein RBG13Loki_1552 [Promethearchaeota archaeon CR_4]|nr:MAG: hypothetical protein RBG13Loki_1552 [Candidatus Lokiarchaeota archaeon CR_4]
MSSQKIKLSCSSQNTIIKGGIVIHLFFFQGAGEFAADDYDNPHLLDVKHGLIPVLALVSMEVKEVKTIESV